MIRVAAAGDLHVGVDSVGTIRGMLGDVGDRADILLLAGDLTRLGTVEEAEVMAEEVRDLPVPVVAVLGNHDRRTDGQTGRRRRRGPGSPCSRATARSSTSTAPDSGWPG